MPLYLSLSHSFSLYCSLHLLCPPPGLSLAFSLTRYISPSSTPESPSSSQNWTRGLGSAPVASHSGGFLFPCTAKGWGKETSIPRWWCYKPPAFSLFLLTIVCGCAFKETASIQQYRLFPTEKKSHIGNNTWTFWSHALQTNPNRAVGLSWVYKANSCESRNIFMINYIQWCQTLLIPLWMTGQTKQLQ